MEINRYRSGYCLPHEEATVFKKETGAGFFITMEDIEDEKKGTLRHLLKKEIIINTSSLKKAVEVSRLIYASLCLIDGCSCPFLFLEQDKIPKVIPLDTDETDLTFNDFMQESTITISEYPLAIKIACKVSRNKRDISSLLIYKTATCIHSNSIDVLDPFITTERIKIPQYTDDKIRMGIAIVTYYSSIDNLGFAWGGGSSVYGKSGKIHKENRSELYRRLKKIGIKNTDTISWNIRNKKTIVTKKKGIKGFPVGYKLPYVLDRRYTFFNAIREISWLRSSVLAHKIDQRYLESISIYDVANANFLARRILLQKFGFWEKYFVSEKEKKSELRKKKKEFQKWIDSLESGISKD